MGVGIARCYKSAPPETASPADGQKTPQGAALTFFQIVALAVVQGVTEFLPISSHAHLILTRHILGLPDGGITFDIAVHVGTLGAVVVYYWRDILFMAAGMLRLLTGRGGPGARMFWLIVVATIPVVIGGYLVTVYLGETLNTVPIIAWTTVIFGVLLFAADHFCMTLRRIEHMNVPQALVIGLAQVIALIPGVSRSGITMTAARVLGFERTDAVRFSLLMSVPAIVGAAALDGFDLYKNGATQIPPGIGLAVFLSFASALVAIPLMVNWLRRATFTPFVIYRLLLGGFLFLTLYWGAVPAGAAG